LKTRDFFKNFWLIICRYAAFFQQDAANTVIKTHVYTYMCSVHKKKCSRQWCVELKRLHQPINAFYSSTNQRPPHLNQSESACFNGTYKYHIICSIIPF